MTEKIDRNLESAQMFLANAKIDTKVLFRGVSLELFTNKELIKILNSCMVINKRMRNHEDYLASFGRHSTISERKGKWNEKNT